MFDGLMRYIYLALTVLIVFFVVAIAIYVYLFKKKRLRLTSENIKTTSFKRADSISYVPITDVIYDGDFRSPGIICIDNYNFVAGIQVRGFNYAVASAQERVEAQINSAAFFNIVEEPISFRQSVRRVDLSEISGRYLKVIENVSQEITDLKIIYDDYIKKAEESLLNKDNEAYKYYKEQADINKRKLVSKKHIKEECENVRNYLANQSADNAKSTAGSRRLNQIMFSYTYDPNDDARELTKEEIYEKAKNALSIKANSYIKALRYCHFSAKRLSCLDLIAIMRRHLLPITGEDYSIDELMDSSYSALFLSSYSIKNAQFDRICAIDYENSKKSESESYDETMALLENRFKDAATKINNASYKEAYNAYRDLWRE